MPSHAAIERSHCIVQDRRPMTQVAVSDTTKGVDARRVSWSRGYTDRATSRTLKRPPLADRYSPENTSGINGQSPAAFVIQTKAAILGGTVAARRGGGYY